MVRLLVPRLKDLYSGLLHIIYPNLCAGCDADLPTSFSCFCFICQRRLQSTDMHLLEVNEFTDRFWGRLPLHSGTAMYYFNRKSPIQNALHKLKYKNQPDIGLRIGRQMGSVLATSPLFDSVEAVIPVPLHLKKERSRGYNQSAMLASGIADTLRVPILSGVLVRQQFADSQTRKKRMERFDNVSEAFVLKKPERIQGKHILLVDDVLTTGATLETCGNALLKAPDIKLSMATIAIAMH